MKKTIVFFAINLLIINISLAQSYKGKVDSILLPETGPAHYQPEYDIDVPVDANAWTKEKAGMHAAFGSEDELYFRTEVPPIKNGPAVWEATGWKGERLNTQIEVWLPDTLQQVHFQISDVNNERGK